MLLQFGFHEPPPVREHAEARQQARADLDKDERRLDLLEAHIAVMRRERGTSPPSKEK